MSNSSDFEVDVEKGRPAVVPTLHVATEIAAVRLDRDLPPLPSEGTIRVMREVRIVQGRPQMI
jgi:hypothetical protein